MAASCWASIVVSPDDVAVAVAAAFEVVAVLLLLPTNSQPANRPTPKIRASTSARSTIAPERPGRFCGGVGGGAIGPAGDVCGWWTAFPPSFRSLNNLLRYSLWEG